EYVSACPSASLDSEPSTVTPVATRAFNWSGPAFANGTELVVLISTASGALFTVPSLTISWTTNVPVRSTTNDGPAVVGPTRTAVLPGGTLVNDHTNVN